MKPVQSAKKNLKSFENIISSIADGSFDDEVSVMLLQIKCKDIMMEAEIYMSLYPESTWPCLRLYEMRIARYLERIKEMQEDCFGPMPPNEMPAQLRMQKRLKLQRLDVVYGKLYRLGLFIEELLD
jgi:hypothetical protein